jgi:hypothetical protein
VYSELFCTCAVVMIDFPLCMICMCFFLWACMPVCVFVFMRVHVCVCVCLLGFVGLWLWSLVSDVIVHKRLPVVEDP